MTCKCHELSPAERALIEQIDAAGEGMDDRLAGALAGQLNREEVMAVHFGHAGDKVTLSLTNAFAMLVWIQRNRKAHA